MRKIIFAIVCLFLFFSSVAFSNEAATQNNDTSVLHEINKLPGQQELATSGFWENSIQQIINEPINWIICLFGTVTFLLNLFCWRSSRKSSKELELSIARFKSDNPNIVHDLTMECLAGIQVTPHLRRLSKISKLIEMVTKGADIEKNSDNMLNNMYYAMVDILPLCGISGTLYAIAYQSFGSSGLNVADLKNTLGIAIFSTLIALLFTIICKLFEVCWIHHIEYVKNIKEIFSLYQINSGANQENHILEETKLSKG